MGSGISKPSDSRAESVSASEVATGHVKPPPPDTPPELAELYQLSNSYKEDSFKRVLIKCALAGAAGLIVGPIANRGPFLNTAIISSANAAIVVGFYDVVREAATATTVCDTPFISGAAGALTGADHGPPCTDPDEWPTPMHESTSTASACTVRSKPCLTSSGCMFRVCLERPGPSVKVPGGGGGDGCRGTGDSTPCAAAYI